MESEVFIPQEYVASCYDYDALFYCEKGKKGQDGHGAPCATTTVEVRGAQAQGWETGNKTGNSISNIDLNGFNLNEELSIGIKLYMIYQNIAFQYEQNNLKSNFGEYYFLGKKAEHKTLDFLPKIKSYLYWFSCGYGERPLYSIYFSFFIIFLFTALFLLVGIDIEGDVIQYSNLKMIEGLSFGEFLKHLLRAFSLSTSLFSGVGDELCEPTIQSVILADIEMIFGVIVMGLGIGTLTRKIVR